MKKFIPLLTLLALALASCSHQPVPVNPDASPQAREVLSFLYSIQGKYTLAGEHNFASDLRRYDAASCPLRKRCSME